MKNQKHYWTRWLILLMVVIGVSFSPIVVQAQGTGVTAKEIEIFGNDLQEKDVEMIAEFVEVSDLYVRHLLHDNRYVGFMVRDSNNDLFQFAFANKEKYGRKLIQMRKGDDLRLTGRVQRVRDRYVLLVNDIQ